MVLIFIINCVLFRKAKISDYNKNADTMGWVNVDTVANGSHVRSDGRILVQGEFFDNTDSCEEARASHEVS